MKGYAGGLVVSAADVLHIGPLGERFPMMWMSASLSCGFLLLRQLEHMDRDWTCVERCGSDVRRFDVKDTVERPFQLESLILAQNERWRQA